MQSFKLALIGHPVDHSYSPWIHNRFLKQTGLTGSYELKVIDPHQFNVATLTNFKLEQWDGFNVTVPFKQAILPFLDKLDIRAERLGAVNTVVQKNGRCIGYNTDGIGYTKALTAAYPDEVDANSRILLLGAGGAARAIYDALLSRGFHLIDIANRTVKTAENLSADLKTKETITTCMSLSQATDKLDSYDLIIQTTSVGLKPEVAGMVLPLKDIKPNVIVSDIVYQPINTRFLTEAKKQGARVHPGHLMLLHQAAHSFEIWTGYEVGLGNMAEDLKSHLEGESKC